MKKYIFLALNLCATLSGMEVPKPKALCTISKSFDMWEFFTEPNKLDSLAGPIPCWNKDNYKNNCSIDTVAILHILQNSNLATKNLKIFDTTCRKGHTSAFLAGITKWVHAYDEDDKDLLYAQQNNSMNNLRFIKKGNIFHNYYDLIIASTPTLHAERLKQLRTLLVPNGEIFCTFVTRSNNQPIATQALWELLPKIAKNTDYFYRGHLQSFADIENKKYPIDETLKHMIDEAQFTIISYEKKSFDILILDKNKFKDLHRLNIMSSPFMQRISDIKKREKIVNQFVDKIISKIKKDAFGCWFYPVDTTIVHIRKND